MSTHIPCANSTALPNQVSVPRCQPAALCKGIYCEHHCHPAISCYCQGTNWVVQCILASTHTHTHTYHSSPLTQSRSLSPELQTSSPSGGQASSPGGTSPVGAAPSSPSLKPTESPSNTRVDQAGSPMPPSSPIGPAPSSPGNIAPSSPPESQRIGFLSLSNTDVPLEARRTLSMETFLPPSLVEALNLSICKDAQGQVAGGAEEACRERGVCSTCWNLNVCWWCRCLDCVLMFLHTADLHLTTGCSCIQHHRHRRIRCRYKLYTIHIYGHPFARRTMRPSHRHCTRRAAGPCQHTGAHRHV